MHPIDYQKMIHDAGDRYNVSDFIGALRELQRYFSTRNGSGAVPELVTRYDLDSRAVRLMKLCIENLAHEKEQHATR